MINLNKLIFGSLKLSGDGNIYCHLVNNLSRSEVIKYEFSVFRNDFIKANLVSTIYNLLNFWDQYILLDDFFDKPFWKNLIAKHKFYNIKRNNKYKNIYFYINNISDFNKLTRYLEDNGILVNCHYSICTNYYYLKKEGDNFLIFVKSDITDELSFMIYDDQCPYKLKIYSIEEFINKYERYKKIITFKMLPFKYKLKYLFKKS